MDIARSPESRRSWKVSLARPRVPGTAFFQLLFLLSVAWISCQDREPVEWEPTALHISHDTIHVCLPGRLEKALRYEQKIYCFVASSNPYSSKSFSDFYILNSTGKVEQRIEVPEEMNTYYYDLHIRNDSVLVKVYMGKGTFYLDQLLLKWVRIKDVDDVVFEDARWYVNFLDFGEFGATSWFRDKRTGQEYELATRTPVVNVLNDTFYLSSASEVLRVIDPTQLRPCTSSSTYENTLASGNANRSYARQGAEVLVHTTADIISGPDTIIVTSFIANDSVYLLCAAGNRSFIGSFQDGQVKEVQSVCENMIPFIEDFQYRRSMDPKVGLCLLCGTIADPDQGLIEVKGSAVRVTHILNSYAPTILGRAVADRSFKALLEHQLNGPAGITLTELAPLALAMGGTDVTPKHHVSVGTDLYPNPKGFVLETPRSYKIIEDSTFTLLMEHFYTQADGSIKCSLYNWQLTKEPDYGMNPPTDARNIRRRFEERISDLKKLLNSEFGSQLINTSSSRTDREEWSDGCGAHVHLSTTVIGAHSEIRLCVYRE